MIEDALLHFTGSLNGASGGIVSTSLTDAPTTGTQQASNIIDLGIALGIPTSANGGGARDLGIGDYPAMKLSAIIGTTFLTGTNLQVTLSGAPDNGSGALGSLTVMWTGPVVAVANLISGAQLCNVDLPRAIFEQVLPRFLILSFVTTGSSMTAGTIDAAIVLDLDQQIMGITGAYSGYPAGITVAN